MGKEKTEKRKQTMQNYKTPIKLNCDTTKGMSPISFKQEVQMCVEKLEIWFYQFSIDYSKINPDERDVFERDVIQGHTTAKTFIEKLVELNRTST